MLRKTKKNPKSQIKCIRNIIKKEGAITLVVLVVTMVLHYYYCIKYSNSNGFLKAIV